MPNTTVFSLQATNESGEWVTLPTPALGGFTIQESKVWSANTGRDSAGVMQGTLIGIKRKVTMQWPPLTYSDAETIRSVVGNSNGFASLKVTWVDGGDPITINGYWGDAEFPAYSFADYISHPWDEISCDFIER